MKLSEKLEKLSDTLVEIKVELARQSVLHAKNTEDLAEHIRRTDISEDRLDALTLRVEKKETKGSTIWQTLTTIGSVLVTIVTLAISYFKS